MKRDVIMEEEKRMMDANPPVWHATRQLWKGSRSHFIYINLLPCQRTFLKHPCGGWLRLCLLMTMNGSMFNPTWRHGLRFSPCASLGYFQEVGSFLQFFFSFFVFLLQAVINMEKQSHEISHWLQSGL